MYHESYCTIGAKGYTEAKLRSLLNIIRQQLPVGGDEWQLVADIYNKQHKVRVLNNVTLRHMLYVICLIVYCVLLDGACEMGLFEAKSKFFKLCDAYLDPCDWGSKRTFWPPKLNL